MCVWGGGGGVAEGMWAGCLLGFLSLNAFPYMNHRYFLRARTLQACTDTMVPDYIHCFSSSLIRDCLFVVFFFCRFIDRMDWPTSSTERFHSKSALRSLALRCLNGDSCQYTLICDPNSPPPSNTPFSPS